LSEEQIARLFKRAAAAQKFDTACNALLSDIEAQLGLAGEPFDLDCVGPDKLYFIQDAPNVCEIDASAFSQGGNVPILG
jgi:hypothetical protein